MTIASHGYLEVEQPSDVKVQREAAKRASAIARGLTKPQRKFVADGSIHGDCAMVTVRALQAKGLFCLVIDSPNGRCGFMRLTPLGEIVRAWLNAEHS